MDVFISLSEKTRDDQWHSCSSSYQIQGHSWVVEKLLCSFSCLIFREKIFALTLFLPSPVPLVQHFLITSVFIGLFQTNLAALPQLGSHSCEVPMVFIKITVLACAVVCLWWRWKHACSACQQSECPQGSGHSVPVWQVRKQGKVHRRSWGPFGGSARKKREVDVCLLW